MIYVFHLSHIGTGVWVVCIASDWQGSYRLRLDRLGVSYFLGCFHLLLPISD